MLAPTPDIPERSGLPGDAGNPVGEGPRRVVKVGSRLVPLSVLLAVVATGMAVFFGWRLYSPTWAGGVGRVIQAPQPSSSKVENAPGPDNSITALPPPDLRSPPVSSDKKESKP